MAHSIPPRKSLGQNFLRDPNTIRKIVASLEAEPGDAVVEIGPGTGALTGHLAASYTNFLAIEIDERAVELLAAEHPGVDVRHQDVLEIDWEALAAERGGPLHVIGNLPYYITSQILFSVLDAGDAVAEAVFMMQLEVAERLAAQPRTKAYGILSVWTQLNADVRLLFRVSRHVFFPKPDVTSAVVRIVPFRDPPFRDRAERERTRAVVRAAFNQRRKVMRNSLGRLSSGKEIPEAFAGKRAEELAPPEFLTLAQQLGSGRAE